MTANKSVPPEEIERILADRTAGEKSSMALSLEELSPRRLLSIATSRQGRLDALDGALDWETLLNALDELPENERAQWLLDVIRRLGTWSGAGIEAETGIRALGERAYELRHQHPHIFLCYLHELHRLLRSEQSAEAVAAAEEQFRRLAAESDRASGDRIQDFHEQNLRDRLVDPNLGAESRTSLLEMLAAEPLEDIHPGVIIDLLYPLRNHHETAVERAALNTLESWATDLASHSVPDDVIETLEASLAGEQEELAEAYVRELLVTGYVAPAVIEWLTELPNVAERQAVVEAAFQALQRIPGIRGFSDQLCTFLLEQPLEETTIHPGIDLLGSILVGLVPDQHTEEPAQDDHIRRVFFTDEELAADRTIRQTLRTLAEDETRSREVRAHAVRTWLSVRPPEIHEVLWEIDPEAIGDDSIVDAKLEAAADHRLIEFVDIAEQLWEDGADTPDRLKPLAETLSDLQTREIVDILLTPAFDHDDPELRDEAQEALIESGYEAELVRERRRRTLLERIEERYQAMAAVAETEREIRNRKATRLTTEADRKRSRVRASEALSRSVDVLARFRAQGTGLMLQLAQEFTQLEQLAARIDQLREQQVELRNQIQEERDEAERLANEIQSVERDIDQTESDLENAQGERDRLNNEIPTLEREISNLETQVDQLEQEVRDLKRQEPSPPAVDDEQRQREYRNRQQEWERQLNQLQSEYESARNKLQNTKQKLQQAKNRRRELENEIRNLQKRLQELKNRHSNLSRQLDESNQRLNQYAEQLEELATQLDQLTDEYESCQQRIAQLTERLSQLRQDAERDRSQMREQRQNASSNAADARVRLESLMADQSSARGTRQQQNERIQRLQQRIDDDHEAFEEAGQRTKVESIEADERAAEASQQVATQQYRENVNRWRLDSILRRTTEGEVIEETAGELTERSGGRRQ
jgi:predicted  nucleic acid-binding Zn-ribbon protein